MKYQHISLIALCWLLMVPAMGIDTLAVSDSSDFPDKYLHLGFGTGYSSVRDIGTSPLRYQGVLGRVNFGYVSESPSRSWGINSDAFFSAGVAENYYQLNYISGTFNTHYLYTIPIDSLDMLQFQAGGSYSSAFAVTINSSYGNATLNIDFFNAFYISGRVIYPFTRPARTLKIWFIHIRKPQRDYALSYQLDIPLLLINNRPEFSYVLNGLSTDFDIFSGHRFVGGFHLRSNLGLTRYLKNGNAVQWSYIWDMFTTGSRDIYLLETASHTLQFTFYFKLN